MNILIVLFDTPHSRLAMYPLSLTRPIADFRLGILTLREWWQSITGLEVYHLSEAYLQTDIPAADLYICVDATRIVDLSFVNDLVKLKSGDSIEDEHGLIAYAAEKLPVYGQIPVWLNSIKTVDNQFIISHISSIFLQNSAFICMQFRHLATLSPTSAICSSNTIIGADIFVEEGVNMNACIINTTEGPVYIGKNALVMEGTMIRGPVAIGEGAVVKMGTKLYGGTTIGPYCTAGGEIKNAVMFGYSNKAHDGYLGDAVVGEWCNFGAGSSNSNVKNTAATVKMWQEATQSFEPVGAKGGVVMGDYSRCAINTSFNTGTTIGVSCNIFDGNYPPLHLASFSWGNYEPYIFEKACNHAANWKKFKGKEFTHQDRLILRHVFEKRHPAS